MIEEFTKFNKYTYKDGVNNDRLDIIKYLYYIKNNEEPINDHWIGDIAALNGNLDILKFLYKTQPKENPICTKSALHWATCNDHMEVMIWLYSNCYEDIKEIFTCISWMHASGNKTSKLLLQMIS